MTSPQGVIEVCPTKTDGSRRGVPIEVVSKTLRHKDITVTYKVYRHVLDSEKRAHAIDLFPIQAPQAKVGISPLN